MGRSKEPQAPSYATGEIRYGNNTAAKSYVDPVTGALINQYLPDELEQQRRQLSQQKMNDLISGIYGTSPELSAQYDQTEKSYVDDAISKYQDQYNPALRGLREDIASRFGTLNNSNFFDKLNDLEKNKSTAFADIVNRGKQLKYDLVNQDQANKLNALQGISGIFNSDRSNALNNIQTSSSASSALNDFLNSQYMTQLKDYRDQQANNSSSVLNGILGGVGGSALTSLIGDSSKSGKSTGTDAVQMLSLLAKFGAL